MDLSTSKHIGEACPYQNAAVNKERTFEYLLLRCEDIILNFKKHFYLYCVSTEERCSLNFIILGWMDCL